MSTDLVVSEHALPDVPAFLSELDVSPSTIHSYKKKMSAFRVWLYESNITEPKSTDIRAYKKHLAARGLSVSSVNQYLSAIRAFFRWAEESGRYPDIARSVRGDRAPQGHAKDALSEDDMKKCLEISKTRVHKRTGNVINDPRSYAVMALLFGAGLRTVEVIRANRGSYTEKDGVKVLYVWGKGRKQEDDFVKLPPFVSDALDAYLATRGGAIGNKEPLFVGERSNKGNRMSTRAIQRIAVSVFERAGVRSERITPHSCRHSCVTLLLNKKVDPRRVQEHVRHARFETTQIYARDLKKLDSPAADVLSEALSSKNDT